MTGQKVKETIPYLRATNGSVVFVSSGAATNAYTSWGAYGSSKAALNSLARHVAVEEPNISAVAISPGRVDTDMQREVRDKGGPAMAEKDYTGFVSAYEGGTLNKPEWPAAVIANLAVGMDPKLSGQYFRYVLDDSSLVRPANQDKLERAGARFVPGEEVIICLFEMSALFRTEKSFKWWERGNESVER